MSDKYTLPDYAVSRIRYYDGQFLLDSDFIDEQNYHIGHQRRHERLLHAAGITEGLNVTKGPNGTTVTVSAGSAVDGSGRQILLDAEESVVVGSGLNGWKVQKISFIEEETDLADQKSVVSAATRFT